MTLEEAKKRLLADEGFRKAYEELEDEYRKIKCDKCENNGVVGACQGRYDTGMNWVCNFYPRNGSATITIHNTFVEAST